MRYLDTPPSAEEIDRLLRLLGLEPRELMRRGESLYTELDLARYSLSRDELIESMAANPRLIERPILVTDRGARIGRPPEAVLEIL